MTVITPSKRKLKLNEYATVDIPWRIEDKFENPVDLTGWTARAQIKSEIDSNEILTITTEDDASIANIQITPEIGRIVLHFQRVLESYAGIYDLYLFDASGNTHKLVLPSTITVSPAVTEIE